MTGTLTIDTVEIDAIGGPTMALHYAGFRFLTDPTFDGPRDYPMPIPGLALTKLTPPRRRPDDIGDVDIVLLSHDEHADNLDDAGRDVVRAAPLTLTTVSGAERLGGTARGLAPWETYDAADGRIRITAVPALHGPEFAADFLADVTGFVLEADGHPTVYVSGDNASLTLVEQIAARFPAISIALLFAGGARIAPVADNNLLTLDSALAARAAALMPNATIVPTHYEGWSHFTEGADDLVARFREAGLADRLAFA